jgi:hypothetical protein
MMGIKTPDFKIETLQELESYLGIWVDHQVGVRLDSHAAKGVMTKILSEEIPHKREPTEGASVVPDYSIGLITLYYMLARALGARYGVDFGHWTDDGTNFHSWKVQRQSTLRALNYTLKILFTKPSAMKLGQSLLYQLPLTSSQVDKAWIEAIARNSRVYEQIAEAAAHEFASIQGTTVVEIEQELYEVELGENLKEKDVNTMSKASLPKKTEGITFLERVDAAHLPFSSLSAPDEVPEALRGKLGPILKKWMSEVERLTDA